MARRPGFAAYMTAIFVPPLYFLMRGRWLAFILNGAVYTFALLTVFFGIGLLPWAFCAAHAIFDFRSERKQHDIADTAELVAARVTRQQTLQDDQQRSA